MIEFLKKLFGFGDKTKKEDCECCPPVVQDVPGVIFDQESYTVVDRKLDTEVNWPANWPFPTLSRPEDQPKPSVADRKKRNLQKKPDAPKAVAAMTAPPKVSLAPPSEKAIKTSKKPAQQKKSKKK